MASAAPSSAYSPEKWWSADTVAVVTGTNKGIGKEIARLLAEQGLTVIATARNESLGRAAAADIEKAAGASGGRVVFHLLDVSDPTSISAFKAWVQQTYSGGITILVNNAGMAYKGDTFGAQELKATLETNFKGTALLTESLAPLIQPGQGRIITVSSRSGLVNILKTQELRKRFLAASSLEQIEGLVGEFQGLVEAGGDFSRAGWPRSMYGISKLAISMYCRQLAGRLEGKGVKVAACCPGYCATDMSSWRGTQSAAAGADTPVWLALQPSGLLPTGRLWAERQAIAY